VIALHLLAVLIMGPAQDSPSYLSVAGEYRRWLGRFDEAMRKYQAGDPSETEKLNSMDGIVELFGIEAKAHRVELALYSRWEQTKTGAPDYVQIILQLQATRAIGDATRSLSAGMLQKLPGHAESAPLLKECFANCSRNFESLDALIGGRPLQISEVSAPHGTIYDDLLQKPPDTSRVDAYFENLKKIPGDAGLSRSSTFGTDLANEISALNKPPDYLGAYLKAHPEIAKKAKAEYLRKAKKAKK